VDNSIDDKIVEIPRNEKNPAISVTVVKTMDDDCAGRFQAGNSGRNPQAALSLRCHL